MRRQRLRMRFGMSVFVLAAFAFFGPARAGIYARFFHQFVVRKKPGRSPS